MADREKLENVIKGLECCLEIRNICFNNPDCPYNDCEDRACGDGCMSFMMRDALALLKAQESRMETQGRWERVGLDIVCCSKCGMPMKKTHVYFPDGESGYYYIATKYCPHCGAKNEKGDCDA